MNTKLLTGIIIFVLLVGGFVALRLYLRPPVIYETQPDAGAPIFTEDYSSLNFSIYIPKYLPSQFIFPKDLNSVIDNQKLILSYPLGESLSQSVGANPLFIIQETSTSGSISEYLDSKMNLNENLRVNDVKVRGLNGYLLTQYSENDNTTPSSQTLIWDMENTRIQIFTRFSELPNEELLRVAESMESLTD